MNAKQAGLLLGLLWLAGCATTGPAEPTCPAAPTETNGPTETNRPTKQTEAIELNGPTGPADATTDRAGQPDTPPATAMSTLDETKILTLSRMLERIDRVTAFGQNNANQPIPRITIDTARLLPADQYERALLTARKELDEKTVNRTVSLLNGLEENAENRAVREILRLQQRNLILERRYQTERKKTIQLQKKIERLKGLEQDLDKSNRPLQESLTPQPQNIQ